MQTQRSYYLGMLILGVTTALAACLLVLASVAEPAQAATQRGDLSISQTDTPDPLESGYLTYGLTVKHELVDDGCGGECYSSYTMRVTDTLPAGVNVMEINYPTRTTQDNSVNISCTGTNTITCTIGNLYDGDSVNIDIVTKVTTAGAQDLTNTATVSTVDGYQDPNTGNNSSTVTTQVSESYTPPSGCASACPNTTLTQKPEALSSTVSPSFSFTSSEANSTFECKMDDGAFQSCSSPKQYFLLSEGQHTFQVRAKNTSGEVDPIPATHTWELDSRSPKITFTDNPDQVTNDTTPSWDWTVEDANPYLAEDYCRLYESGGDYRTIYSTYGCSSPLNFDAALPDGYYGFWIQSEDRAGNYGYSDTNYFEVDTAAPKIVSAVPTGRSVRPSADVVVTFDDEIYRSGKFVNIYKRGSTTPLAVYRYAYNGDNEIEISPKNYLRRDTRYTVKVTTGVNDGANNLEAPKTWSFKTR